MYKHKKKGQGQYNYFSNNSKVKVVQKVRKLYVFFFFSTEQGDVKADVEEEKEINMAVQGRWPTEQPSSFRKKKQKLCVYLFL